MRAILYYQRFSIVHRDLKPENLLFYDKHDLTSVSVIDFGIAKRCHLTSLKSKSGTVTMLLIVRLTTWLRRC